MWLLVAAAWGAIPDAPPPPIVLDADEQALVSSGGFVVRTTGSGGAGGAVGVVDVAAPVSAVLQAIVDVRARVGEVGGLETVDVYLDEPGRMGARFVLRMFGVNVAFHTLYRIDRDAGWIRYGLDPAQTNDLVKVEGSYQVYRVGETTRMVYSSETDSGRSVPGFVRNWLTSKSLQEQMGGIKARAEAASR